MLDDKAFFKDGVNSMFSLRESVIRRVILCKIFVKGWGKHLHFVLKVMRYVVMEEFPIADTEHSGFCEI